MTTNEQITRLKEIADNIVIQQSVADRNDWCLLEAQWIEVTELIEELENDQ